MSHNVEQNEPMSDGLTDDHIRKWIEAAEKREIARTGLNKPEAREALARSLTIGYWSLVNVIRGRVKGLRGDVRDRIKAGIIRNLESEIARLENELALVRKCNSGLCEANILAAQAAIEQARKFLKGE
jgi:hypothetical protein